MSKEYYTPNIRDIHIGLEVEYYEFVDNVSLEKGWRKVVVDPEMFGIILCSWKAKSLEKDVRIECISSRSIEKLFAHKAFYSSQEGTVDYVSEDGRFKLVFYPKILRIEISGEDSFSGSIRGVDELKVIMKQLGISKRKLKK